MSTKKVKSAGRFGARYGTKVRKIIIKIESQRKNRECPNCLKNSLERLSTGIWKCKKCSYKFAGKAYKPK
ncbi:MAG: 50S ribosomal protein L37ae [Candidatus Aenigmarchaeota archaeon]|nr:50S ribosomal protein L37ae [Candidatus Aenigmarchaeota archaeon]